MQKTTDESNDDYSVAACLQWAERYRAEDYIPNAMARNWVLSLKALAFGDLKQDVRKMEFDNLVRRLINKGTNPETATTYGQRANKCRSQFLTYMENPKAFKPIPANRRSPRLPKAAASNGGGNGAPDAPADNGGELRVRVDVLGGGRSPQKIEVLLTKDNVDFIEQWLTTFANAALEK